MIRASVSLLALLVASPAFAQGSGGNGAPPAATKKVVPPEVERGIYTEFDFGTIAFFGGTAGDNVQPGVMAGFGIGTDIGRYLKLEFRMLNSTADSTGKLYETTGEVPIPTDVQNKNPCPDQAPGTGPACTTAPDVQVSLLTGGIKGVYPVSDRLELQGLIGGGVMMSNPAPDQIFDFNQDTQLVDPVSVESGSNPIFGGGVGIEYFTHLRHFSVGANVAAWTALGTGGTMVTLFPTIKYTF